MSACDVLQFCLPSFEGNLQNDNEIHPLVLWDINVDVYITTKHNQHVIISSVCAIYFGPQGPSSCM